MPEKIVRSICAFSADGRNDYMSQIHAAEEQLVNRGFVVQTRRLCVKSTALRQIENSVDPYVHYISFGKHSLIGAQRLLDEFLASPRASINLDLTNESITIEHAKFLFEIIRKGAHGTFGFSYSCNTPPSGPFFNSTYYERDGFSIGLQSPNLSVGCTTVEEWLTHMWDVWREIVELFGSDQSFLGIDSSVAPLNEGASSLINFVRRLGGSFESSVTTDLYTRITRFLTEENPKPIGLNGLMFACLEDFELADEYERGNFSIERNIYLSLHSGLGIDTYPLGIDEPVENVLHILRLVQALSRKYQKPLSVRFVSDGTAMIGAKTNFKNTLLKDVVVRPLRP